VALYRGKVLTKGMVWGEDMILEAPSLRHKAAARAMSFLEAYYLSRDELLTLGKRHPETARAIRQHVIWLALRRELVARAREHRAALGQQSLVSKAAHSLFDAVDEATAATPNPGIKLGNKDNEPPPAEIGADGKLMISSDLGVNFEIFGGQMQDERRLAGERFNQLEAMQARTLESLQRVEEGRAQHAQRDTELITSAIEARLVSAVARAVEQSMAVVAMQQVQQRDPSMTTAIAAAVVDGYAQARRYDRHDRHDRHDKLEDREQDGQASGVKGAPPVSRRRRKHPSSRAAATTPPSASEPPARCGNGFRQAESHSNGKSPTDSTATMLHA